MGSMLVTLYCSAAIACTGVHDAFGSFLYSDAPFGLYLGYFVLRFMKYIMVIMCGALSEIL